jgi:hypothetical protein
VDRESIFIVYSLFVEKHYFYLLSLLFTTIGCLVTPHLSYDGMGQRDNGLPTNNFLSFPFLLLSHLFFDWKQFGFRVECRKQPLNEKKNILQYISNNYNDLYSLNCKSFSEEVSFHKTYKKIEIVLFSSCKHFTIWRV